MAKAVAHSELLLHYVSLNSLAFGHCKCCMEHAVIGYTAMSIVSTKKMKGNSLTLNFQYCRN